MDRQILLLMVKSFLLTTFCIGKIDPLIVELLLSLLFSLPIFLLPQIRSCMYQIVEMFWLSVVLMYLLTLLFPTYVSSLVNFLSVSDTVSVTSLHRVYQLMDYFRKSDGRQIIILRNKHNVNLMCPYTNLVSVPLYAIPVSLPFYVIPAFPSVFTYT